MSTYNIIFKIRKGAGLSALSVLGWLLVMMLPLFPSLSPAAFAATHYASDQAPATQDIARAGVSVVRLVVTYALPATQSSKAKPPNGPGSSGIASTNPITCTGLGVIVASWTSANATDQNAWILTDGALVNPDAKVGSQAGATCTTIADHFVLSGIQMFLSTAYSTTTTPVPVPLDTTLSNVHCDNAGICNKSPVLVSFHAPTALYPYLDLSTGDMQQEAGIGLSASAAPTRVPLGGGNVTGSSGMPLVNKAGELVGMSLSTGVAFPFAGIKDFMNNLSIVNNLKVNPNKVHDDWVQGMTAFYQPHPDYALAKAKFDSAARGNTEFQGAGVFSQLAQDRATAGNTGSNPSQSKNTAADPLTKFFNTFPMLVWVLIGVGVLLLIVLLFVTTRMLRRARTQSADFKADLAAAEQQSKLDAQRMAAQEAHSAPQQLQPTLVLNPIQPVAVSNNVARMNAAPLPEFPCPRCATMVQKGVKQCPNCHLALSPSDSAIYARSQQAPANNASDYPTVVEMSPSLQRPFEMSPSLQRPNEMSPAWPNPAEMSPTLPRNQQVDTERTMTYQQPLQQVRGNRLGFAVGTRSDPGIKRKYKPNEDSFFVAQGIRDASTALQQVGVFVVADGMGGHASGRDASRTAIQTIIEYMLPRLSKSGEAKDEAFIQLLTTSIQKANQAVHQHNQEQHVDMGTTVTAALVVDMTAYVANVGDSRTYLYREGQGLQKVTADHSVVASLVQAGIIKPDDIYTHPKRNQIYRSLGEKPVVDVDSFTVQLQVGDKLLLCSDGLWDMVRDPKIEEVMKSPVPDPDMTGKALIEAALAGGGEDNVSVIVVHITEQSLVTGEPNIQIIRKSDSVQLPASS